MDYGAEHLSGMAGRLSMSASLTLAVTALVSALLLVPSAGAAAPQKPVPAAVQQAVGSVKAVTGGVTATVERTTSQVTEPVTAAVAQTTTRTTQAVRSAVEETVSRTTRRLQPAADDIAGAVDGVAAGVTRQASASLAATVSSTPAQPPAAEVTAPQTRGPRTGQGPAPRPKRAARLRPERSEGHPAGARQVRESGDPTEPGRSVAAVATAAPPAAPLAAVRRTPVVESVTATGSRAPYPDLPAAAGSSASSLASGLALGSLALLATALWLTVPGLLQRLRAAPVARRPVAFSYALERPG
jgi:hypothetical protein